MDYFSTHFLNIALIVLFSPSTFRILQQKTLPSRYKESPASPSFIFSESAKKTAIQRSFILENVSF
ncbi:hypothetical protein HMPREF0322_01055 [Desulfitobacterium hafniense DP7]|uniref:Uncharacterized protein n=1 Tax=Desulfitobacterium hafniense DP7 TaxID=537010 RepID=G9XJC4_DESHA|nr:hypothetical protein HMPREF0322_01055 [Desulfitobacterium hafniense DP7]